MNVEIGTVSFQFLFCEYLFPIFGIGSLQCTSQPDGDAGGEQVDQGVQEQPVQGGG